MTDLQLSHQARELLDTVVKPEFCIGCGACAALPHSELEMQLDSSGRYRPVPRAELPASPTGAYTRVCPFASVTDEDALAKTFLSTEGRHDDRLGTFSDLHAGHANTDNLREQGSSGGITTWFVKHLLEHNLVDAVLHVKPVTDDEKLFIYEVSETPADATARSKTRYYPVEMSGVLEHVRSHPGRYAVVGLPCFIKSVRLLQLEDPVFRERVAYCVGLVCGHLKSTNFANSLAWEMGVAPSELAEIEFRAKNDVAADAYDVVATKIDGTQTRRRNASLMAADWGIGMFKYRACDYCDDVTAETADISLGDAWLPEFSGDPQGTNVVIARSSAAAEILRKSGTSLELASLTPDQVAQSQAAGLRHRREGLAYRLSKTPDAPPKRVRANARIPRTRASIYDQRSELIDLADAAFQSALDADNWQVFPDRMSAPIAKYRATYAQTNPVRAFVRQRLPWLLKLAKRIRATVKR